MYALPTVTRAIKLRGMRARARSRARRRGAPNEHEALQGVQPHLPRRRQRLRQKVGRVKDGLVASECARSGAVQHNVATRCRAAARKRGCVAPRKEQETHACRGAARTRMHAVDWLSHLVAGRRRREALRQALEDGGEGRLEAHRLAPCLVRQPGLRAVRVYVCVFACLHHCACACVCVWRPVGKCVGLCCKAASGDPSCTPHRGVWRRLADGGDAAGEQPPQLPHVQGVLDMRLHKQGGGAERHRLCLPTVNACSFSAGGWQLEHLNTHTHRHRHTHTHTLRPT